VVFFYSRFFRPLARLHGTFFTFLLSPAATATDSTTITTTAFTFFYVARLEHQNPDFARMGTFSPGPASQHALNPQRQLICNVIREKGWFRHHCHLI
jgi:hypothetical protein